MQLAGFKGWSCSCGKVHARPEQGGSPAEASARQEPPPKCLVIYAEGMAEAVECGRAELTALHNAARGGCCGFVALRTPPPPDADAAAAHGVAQLLCLLDGATPLAQRTKGLRVAVASGVAAVRACAAAAGAAAVELGEPAQHDALASQCLELLGLDRKPALRGEAADLVVAHLRPAAAAPWQPSACDAAAAALDALLQTLVACPDVAQCLYVVLLLGRSEPVQPGCAPPTMPAHLAHLRPEQSFSAQRRGGTEEHALLCVHSLRGVVRRDEASYIGHAEFVARGARGTVLADDVLAELAFKLGRASKYGA